MSRNLVKTIRRHHEQGAPTALDVLKEALAPPGTRHVRVCNGTPCFAATGDAHVDEIRGALGLALGERNEDGAVSLAEPVLTLPGDWSGPRRALAESTPEALPEAVVASDVRARGGAGFPASRKWEFARGTHGERKFIAANGDEGDPGSCNADLLARDVLEMHPDDAARLWIEDGEAISVRSRHGSIEIIAEVTDRIERGHVLTTFHFPETRTNLLIGQLADDNTSCPEYQVVAVDVRPIGEQSTMTPALAGAAGS